MKKILILILIVLFINYIRINNLIIFSERITSLFITIIGVFGILSYIKEFKSIKNSLICLTFISIGTLAIDLSMIQIKIFNKLIWINLIFGFLLSSSIILYFLEGNIFKDIKKIITIALGYYIFMITIGNFLIFSNLTMGLYPKIADNIFSKCIDNKCIDIHKTIWKLGYFTIYSYDKDLKYIKYKTFKKPDIYFDSYGKDVENKTKVDGLISNFNFIKDNKKYILYYKNIKGESKEILIK